jgi:hypothetical protein
MIVRMENAETMLATLETARFQDSGEAIAEIAAVVSAVNRELEGEPDEDRIRKLREWVKRLHAGVKNAAQQVGAESFSISVGFPLGISVGVEWDV